MITPLPASCRRAALRIHPVCPVSNAASLRRSIWSGLAPNIRQSSAVVPKAYPAAGFDLLDPASKIEEERLPDYHPARFYPAVIGEVLRGRFQIVGKVGFSHDGTYWLCRDLRYVGFGFWSGTNGCMQPRPIPPSQNQHHRFGRVATGARYPKINENDQHNKSTPGPGMHHQVPFLFRNPWSWWQAHLYS
jgi:hypothetical protein